MKALIINFNRLTLPIKTSLWCANHGLEPIFIDNNSTYLPLLEYYATRCPFKVLRMDQNYGAHVIWHQNVLNKLGITGNYIVTDPDLDLSGIPDDFLSVLEAGLRKYPNFDKCGFSLSLDGVKNEGTLDWEAPFWKLPLDNLYFNAIIDTTFALYKTHTFSFSGIRTNKPYCAIHVPWQYDRVEDLPEDEQFYYRTQDEDTANHTHVKKGEKK